MTLFKVQVGSPSAVELVDILDRTTGASLPEPAAVADAETVLAMQALAREVPVATPVAEYAARLVVATHPDGSTAPDLIRRYVRYGSSPRGAQALLLGARVNALLEGRYNGALADVRAVAPAALRGAVRA